MWTNRNVLDSDVSSIDIMSDRCRELIKSANHFQHTTALIYTHIYVREKEVV